jgi:hypothetical protein
VAVAVAVAAAATLYVCLFSGTDGQAHRYQRQYNGNMTTPKYPSGTRYVEYITEATATFEKHSSPGNAAICAPNARYTRTCKRAIRSVSYCRLQHLCNRQANSSQVISSHRRQCYQNPWTQNSIISSSTEFGSSGM